MIRKRREITNDVEKAIKNRDLVPPKFEDCEQHGVCLFRKINFI